MKKIGCLFILLTLFISFSGCRNWVEHYYLISIYNESDKKIYFFLSQETVLIDGRFYPDTVLPDTKVGTPIESKSRLGDEFLVPPKGDPVYSLFIFDAKVIENEPWDSIRSGYKVLMRYDLHVNDEHLRPLNFKITYPPSENMKDIHIYPPYDGWDK